MDHILPNSQDKENNILFKLTPLTRATVAHRPSKSCKTPYVADIVLESSTNTDNIEIAHSPSLGCCGLCDSKSVVFVQPTYSEKGKCSYRIMLSSLSLLSSIKSEDNKNETDNYVYVATHSRLAEDVVKYALSLDLINELKGHISKYTKEQVTFGNSRFDFAGIGASGRPFLLEVKCVPLADFEDIPSRERKNKLKNNYYKNWNSLDKVAYFPDGYRKNKTDVISPRALKHIEELGDIASSGEIDAYMCFVIQRHDASRFVISCIDPVYRASVKKAIEKGVKIITLKCRYDEHGVCQLIQQDLFDYSCFTTE